MTNFNLGTALIRALNLDTVQCENCKAANPATVPCCGQCGNKLPNQVARENECDPILHYVLSAVKMGGQRNEQKFCTQCGEKLFGR